MYEEPIKRLNAHSLKRVHAAMAKALEDVSDELNIRITIETKNYAHDGSSATLIVQCFLEDAMTALQTDGQLLWNKDCGRYGLSQHDYGREITLAHTGERYKLNGIKTRNKKYPIIALKLTGPRKGLNFKLQIDPVRAALL